MMTLHYKNKGVDFISRTYFLHYSNSYKTLGKGFVFLEHNFSLLANKLKVLNEVERKQLRIVDLDKASEQLKVL